MNITPNNSSSMEILIFFIVIGLIFFQEVQKKLTSTSTNSPKDVLSDNFPVFTYEEEKSDSSISEMEEAEVCTRKQPKRMVREVKKHTVPPVVQNDKQNDTTATPEKIKLNLHNRTEARKAFLYAEIFRRKYE